jgi:hypothetical protein
MTALALERLTPFAGVVPSRGTYPVAANTRIFKGSIVCLNASGDAIPGDDAAGGAVVCVGKASSTIDNRTGSPAGGSAGDIDVEVEFGVFGWENSASTEEVTNADVGTVVYVVDDQTVGETDASATLVAAGVCTEVRDGKVWVWMGPHVIALSALT